jgi:hypothetical protein
MNEHAMTKVRPTCRQYIRRREQIYRRGPAQPGAEGLLRLEICYAAGNETSVLRLIAGLAGSMQPVASTNVGKQKYTLPPPNI